MYTSTEKLLEMFLFSSGVTIDNRNITGNEMFFGLKGEHADGNKFASAAMEKGALCCVVDNEAEVRGENYFLVEDSLVALQQLSKLYRSTFTFPVLALTGSNGKTTTKELIASVLSRKYKTYATRGNLNNHIGVPLTLLSIKNDCQIAVVEFGANHIKEIEFLCSLADPDLALITNIGRAHLEGFGSLEGVKKGKSELYYYIMNKGGIIFANSDHDILSDVYEGYNKVIKYGTDKSNFLYGEVIDNGYAAVNIFNRTYIQSHLIGNYNGENILAAACVGKYFEIDEDEIKIAVENYVPNNNRSEFKKINENHFILDAYNANPSSLKAALENFSKVTAKNKIVIMGDMLEMGDHAETEHENIIELAHQLNFDHLVTVGPEFLKHKRDNVVQFMNADDAKVWFNEQHFSGAIILLKGSRGIKLEKIIS